MDYDEKILALTFGEPVPLKYTWTFFATETWDDEPNYEEGFITTSFPGFQISVVCKIRGWAFCVQKLAADNAHITKALTGEDASNLWQLVAYKGQFVYYFRIQMKRLHNDKVKKVIQLMFAPDLLPELAETFTETERLTANDYRNTAKLDGNKTLVLDLPPDGEDCEDAPRT